VAQNMRLWRIPVSTAMKFPFRCRISWSVSQEELCCTEFSLLCTFLLAVTRLGCLSCIDASLILSSTPHYHRRGSGDRAMWAITF
jgi:hypothetical protein